MSLRTWLEDKRLIRKTVKWGKRRVIYDDGIERGLCRLGKHNYHREVHFWDVPIGFSRTYCTYKCHYCGDFKCPATER